ncbi:hypothetical protein AB4Y43_16690 [Paraburkholderia sp. BR10872]|uniref:hypothetical protein n=1 Tax=Paraburkholderia sp. BR10872 TaxID=3236989 RepID=UPI0034D2EC3F
MNKLRTTMLHTLFPILLSVVSSAQAQSFSGVSDPIGISKIVHSIPTFGGDLGSRLAAANMSVESIVIHKLTKDDVAEDPMHVAIGDVEYQIATKGEPQAGGCKILGSPTIIKRGHRYLPEDRTGMWLLTGKCTVPD